MIPTIFENSMMTAEQLLGLNDEQLLNIVDNSELLGQKFRCHHEALVPLAKLIRQSESDGVPIRVVSSHRTFEHQVAIWNRKFNEPVALNRRDGSQVDSQELSPSQRVLAILEYSALPGTSRHHWGTDFDVFEASAIDQGYEVELTESEFSNNGPCSYLDQWLDENLEQFEFYRPYSDDQGGVACEPWHISYRPLATQALKEYPTEELYQALENSNIAGKEYILPKLDYILKKFVLSVS